MLADVGAFLDERQAVLGPLYFFAGAAPSADENPSFLISSLDMSCLCHTHTHDEPMDDSGLEVPSPCIPPTILTLPFDIQDTLWMPHDTRVNCFRFGRGSPCMQPFEVYTLLSE